MNEFRVRDLAGTLPVRVGTAPYPLRQEKDIEGICIHWADDQGHDHSPQAIAKYQTGPTSHLAFPEVAYHYMVTQTGEIFRLLDERKISWHVGEFNLSYLGLLANPPPGGKWTTEQVNAMDWLIYSYLPAKSPFWNGLGVKLHRQLRQTQCPGPYGEWLLEELEKIAEDEDVVEDMTLENLVLTALAELQIVMSEIIRRVKELERKLK